MNRRIFFRALFVIPIAAATADTEPGREPRIVRWSDAYDNRFVPGTHAVLNGVDITNDCFCAYEYDDGTMVAHCYVKDSGGGRILFDAASRCAMREERRGRGYLMIPPRLL